MPSGFLWWRWLSRNAAARLCAAPIAVVVAGQMEVEVLHRDDLAVAATGRSALDPEHGAQARLADRHGGLLADPVQALGQADRRGRLALAERRRRDRGDHHVLAPGVARPPAG